MGDIRLPRGVRDFMPNEALFRNQVIEKIEDAFQLYGFVNIETPKIEPLGLLKAKSGLGDENKLIFEIAEENIGLRYDMTMSLARYIVMHQDIPMPFKRYAIGNVWRMDEPQRLRYREFTQADIDIIGGNEAAANAEVISAACTAYAKLDVAPKISISSRKIVEGAMRAFGVPKEKMIGCMRILDKLDKIGSDGVRGMLDEYAGPDISGKLVEMLDFGDTNEEKIRYATGIAGEDATKEIRDTLALLDTYSSKEAVEIDFSVIRGLDYYTGIVMEARMYSASGKFDVLGGGGRYSDLVKNLGGRELGGVGVALGVDRILETLDISKRTKKSIAEVFVSNVKSNNFRYALGVANRLRNESIPTDMNIAERNISNQMSYAANMGYRYVVIVGDNEEKKNMPKVRDMSSGDEVQVSADELAKWITDKQKSTN